MQRLWQKAILQVFQPGVLWNDGVRLRQSLGQRARGPRIWTCRWSGWPAPAAPSVILGPRRPRWWSRLPSGPGDGRGCRQAVVVKDDADTAGIVLWQRLLGAPCFWAVFCSRTIIPNSEEHPLASSRAVPKAAPRWIRVNPQLPTRWRNGLRLSVLGFAGAVSCSYSMLL